MGEVYLPNVTRAWFYNNDGSSKYAPTDEAGGTPFNVRLEDCADNSSIKQLMFSFTPQSGFWSNQNRVFKNDATTGAAQNVGIVIFSADYKTNVLNSDGSSNVVYDVSGKKQFAVFNGLSVLRALSEYGRSCQRRCHQQRVG